MCGFQKLGKKVCQDAAFVFVHYISKICGIVVALAWWTLLNSIITISSIELIVAYKANSAKQEVI